MAMPWVRFLAVQRVQWKQAIETRNREQRERWQAENAREP